MLSEESTWANTRWSGSHAGEIAATEPHRVRYDLTDASEKGGQGFGQPHGPDLFEC